MKGLVVEDGILKAVSPNERFAKAAGICWHNFDWVDAKDDPDKHAYRCTDCGQLFRDGGNPDFTDAREVLKVMKEKLSLEDFEDWLCEVNRDDVYKQIDVILVLDRTGKLRDLATEWMEGRK